MRRNLFLAVAISAAFAAGWVVRGPGAAPGPLQIGQTVHVVRPTGGVVTGAGGGNPQPENERVTLRVHQRSGAWVESPATVPWVITVGGVRYVCVPE